VKRYMRSFVTRETAGQLVKVGIIGVFNTVVDFGLFNGFRSMATPRNWALALAFAIATFVSYGLNRRWSFQLTDGHVKLRETVHFYIINAVSLGVTFVVVEAADAVFGPLTRFGENVAKLAAVAIIVMPKFAGYRDIVFRHAIRQHKARRVAAGVERD